MEKSNFTLSHSFEISTPKTEGAYPISHSEWNLIKTRVQSIKYKIDAFSILGSILIGAALSSLITNLATDFKDSKSSMISWFIFALCLLVGGLCFLFCVLRAKETNSKPQEIIDHMLLIEARY